MNWDNLSMSDKAELIKIYVANGILDLNSIKDHYNNNGGKITFKQWKTQMQSKYPDIEMDNNKAGYDYETYFNNHYDDAIRQLSNLQHFPDTYKLPNHPTFSNESIYSRGPVIGGTWNSDDTFTPSVINEQYYPDRYDRTGNYTEQRIYNRFPHQYPDGGSTDIQSDWSRKYSQRLALQQLGWDNPSNNLHSDYAAKDSNGYYAGYRLKPVTISTTHPLWDLSDYKGKENNPNINAHKDELYQNRRGREEAGKEYLKRVAGGLSVMALPIGGAAGFVLGVPDLALDIAEMIDKPSVSNTIELSLDAPTRYGTELDNALISALNRNKYTKPLAKILEYNDILQYIGAANDASSAVTGKSIIEHVSK